MTLVWRPGYTTTFADPDVQAYITAVEEADNAALEYRTAVAIDEFVLGCKSDGIWSAIKASCILAGARTLTGALVPLVGAAPTNFNFVAGDYNRKTGLVGNGSTKYLNSNRNNNADPQDNQSISVYISIASTQGVNTGYAGAGLVDAGTSSISRIAGANGYISFRSRNPTDNQTSNGTQDTVGFVGMSRASSTGFAFRQASATSNVSRTSETPFAGNVLILGRTTTSLSSGRLAFYSIGESLDLALLDARVTALITAFGVAIP